MRVRFFVAAAAASSLLVPVIAAALDPAIKCQAAKLKLSGKYASCRLIADANAVKTGTSPDYTSCDTKLQAGWAKVEASLGTECPTTGDLGDVQDSIVECIPSKEFVMRIFMSTNGGTSAVQYFVNYNAVPGSFAGSGNQVSCNNLVVGAIAIFNDHDDSWNLDAGVISLSGNLNGFLEVARCTFENEGIVDPNPLDFAFGVTSATDENGNNVIAPDLSIVLEKAN